MGRRQEMTSGGHGLSDLVTWVVFVSMAQERKLLRRRECRLFFFFNPEHPPSETEDICYIKRILFRLPLISHAIKSVKFSI